MPSPSIQLDEMPVKSTLDDQIQRCLALRPTAQTQPLLVVLHHWSSHCDESEPQWAVEATRRGWGLIQPEYRGPNVSPQACGSPLAQQDILDATHHAMQHWHSDPNRLYLAGVSGGGHMALLMAAMYPDVFAAVNAWVPISDLAAWHAEHSPDNKPDQYAKSIEQCIGGAPGCSKSVDEQLKQRSPIHHMHKAIHIPLDIAAGVHDGHQGSVPIHHSIDAFNVIAAANGDPLVTDDEISQLTTQRYLSSPQPGDTINDSDFQGRRLLLRRYSGLARLTVFDGKHEGLPFAGCTFLDSHIRSLQGI